VEYPILPYLHMGGVYSYGQPHRARAQRGALTWKCSTGSWLVSVPAMILTKVGSSMCRMWSRVKRHSILVINHDVF
jgi:hypothetical protein